MTSYPARSRFDIGKYLASKNVQVSVDEEPRFHRDQKPIPVPLIAAKKSDRSRFNRARFWLQKRPGAIEGQGGRNYTTGVIRGLIDGFDLSDHDAMTLLLEWNQTCRPPWEEHELKQKVEYVLNTQSPSSRAKGYLLESSSERHKVSIIDSILKIGEDFEMEFGIHRNREDDDEKKAESSDAVIGTFVNDPGFMARRFYYENIVEDGMCRYVWINETFYQWTHGKYVKIDEKVFRSIVSHFIESCFNQHYFDSPFIDGKEKKKHKVTVQLVSEVIMMLINMIKSRSENDDSLEFFWLKQQPGDPPASEIMPFRNSLVHIPSFIKESGGHLMPKTPRLFSSYSLKYDFPSVSSPAEFEIPPNFKKLLYEDIWPDDDESIECLQEIMGYLLLPSNAYQKMFMFIGPKRSGKGTIHGVIENLIGRKNICYPTFASMVSTFGLQQFIGKTLAIFSDVRISGRTDIVQAVEQILAITGGDPQTVNRKYMSPVEISMSCRFLITSNEVPRLTDNSCALASRIIALKFVNSFYGMEDPGLAARLRKETPGILLWAIEGLKRLTERGYFIQPESGMDLMEEIESLSSPISQFIKEELEIGDSEEHHEYLAVLYDRWLEWCKSNGHEHPGSKQMFGRNLRSNYNSIYANNDVRMPNGVKTTEYIGVKLIESPEQRAEALRVVTPVPDVAGYFKESSA